MKPARIVMFNCAETQRDPRVRRIAGALADFGHEVSVFGLNSEGLPNDERIGTFTLRRLMAPSNFSRRAMRAIEETSPEAYRLIEACNPKVLSFARDWLLGLPKGGRRAYGLWRRFRDLVSRLTGRATRWPLVEHADDEILGIRCILLFNLTLYHEAMRLRPDVVHCNDLDTLLAGFLVKQACGAKLVFDAHEIYPEQFAEGMRPELWRDFYTRLENALLPYTDARLTVCDSIGEYFQRVYGSGPFMTVRNVPSIQLLAPPVVLERRNRPRQVLYHGMYLPHRGLEELVTAAQYFKDTVLVMRGLGPQEARLRGLAERLQLGDRVRFMPPVSVHELIGHASECDLGLNPFISVCRNTEYALPNKFFEYMAAGLALASSDLVEMRRLTDRHGLGVVFQPQEPRQIADAILGLVSDTARLQSCRENAYEAVRSELHWEQEQAKLAQVYSAIM